MMPVNGEGAHTLITSGVILYTSVVPTNLKSLVPLPLVGMFECQYAIEGTAEEHQVVLEIASCWTNPWSTGRSLPTHAEQLGISAMTCTRSCKVQRCYDRVRRVPHAGSCCCRIQCHHL